MVSHLLESGVVAFVHQTAASVDDPLGNETARSADGRDVFAAAGSRYAPSAPLADLEQSLSRGEPFAFVGKPCDVAALRGLARLDARIDQLVVLAVSFFCAGTPSREGGLAVLEALDAELADVASFRYRGDGWPGHARATFKNGGSAAMSYEDSWGDILSKHLPFRCKICPDGVGGFADIVFADAWECDARGYPLFDEADGKSLILARTEKGVAALEAAQRDDVLVFHPRSLEEVTPMQPGQVRKKSLALSRILALKVLLRRAPRFRGFQLARAARVAGVFANVKSFLGAGKRVATNNR